MLRLLSILLALVPSTAVRAEPLEAPALVRSKARLDLRSPLGVAVLEAPLRDGARFDAGDVLVRFDCATLHAERRAADAALRAERLDVSTKQRLLSHGAGSTGDLKRARALRDRAAGNLDALKSRIGACEVRARFAGRVVRLHARPGEVPSPADPVVTIIDDARLEVEVVAPSRWLPRLRAGVPFRVFLDETGREHAAVVTGTGSEVDPVSRTVRVWGRLEERSGVLAGMSGAARFEARP